MAANVFAPHWGISQINSIFKKIKLRFFKRFLHSVRLDISLREPVTYVTIGQLNLEKKKFESLSSRKKALNFLII